MIVFVCNHYYLIGTWTNESVNSTVGTFNADGTFVDSFGNKVTWTLDTKTNTISLSSNSFLTVKESGFTCDQMQVTIVNSLGTNSFTFIRN